MKTIVWKFPNTGDFCGIFPKYPFYLREHSRRFKADIKVCTLTTDQKKQKHRPALTL